MLCDSLSQHTTAGSKIFTLSNRNVLSGRFREKGQIHLSAHTSASGRLLPLVGGCYRPIADIDA